MLANALRNCLKGKWGRSFGNKEKQVEDIKNIEMEGFRE